MEDNKYLIQRRNRKKQWLRLRLGVLQLIHKPILNVFWSFIVIATIMLIRCKEKFMEYIDVPQILNSIFSWSMNVVVVLIPIILILFMIESIGELSARKDEADLQEAFGKEELRNGFPILMNKKNVKKSNVTIRDFYSSIPLKTWVEKQEDIADSMNIHFVEKMEYGGKSNGKIIVMYTAPGRCTTKRGNLYDNEF